MNKIIYHNIMGNIFASRKEAKDNKYYVNGIIIISFNNYIKDSLYHYFNITNHFTKLYECRSMQVLDILLQERPNINTVIIESNPSLSSYRLSKYLRQKHNFGGLIIVATPSLHHEKLQKLLTCGANDVIHQPFSVNEFVHCINDNNYTF